MNENKLNRTECFAHVLAIISALNDPYTGRGGRTRLGKELGLSPQAVYSMVDKESLPEHHIDNLVEVAEMVEYKVPVSKKNKKLRALNGHDLRPDLYNKDGSKKNA